MADYVPVTETIKASEARQQWSALLNEVFRKEKRVIVEKNGTPLVALISASDFQRFQHHDRKQRERIEILERMSEPFKDVSPEEIEREVARAIQEVREEGRRAKQQRQELAEVLDRMRVAFRDLSPDEIAKEFDRVVMEERANRQTSAELASRS